eukprot:TRINITY_DN9440_c0_g1_i2.p1 TRINITY_DN9440_c0_g1~~TRINITY_DN9440_c0_g1_i2.p1  ORF type:complete len:317 (+),score=91.67 TRINITY_DN9440_c0_g1_i2:84-1034(+)
MAAVLRAPAPPPPRSAPQRRPVQPQRSDGSLGGSGLHTGHRALETPLSVAGCSSATSCAEPTPASSPVPTEEDPRDAALGGALIQWWEAHSAAAPGALRAAARCRTRRLSEWWRAAAHRLSPAAVRHVLHSHARGEGGRASSALVFVAQGDALARGAAARAAPAAARLGPAAAAAEQLRALWAPGELTGEDLRRAARGAVGADPLSEDLPLFERFALPPCPEEEESAEEEDGAEGAAAGGRGEEVELSLHAWPAPLPPLLVALRLCALLGVDMHPVPGAAAPGSLRMRLHQQPRRHLAAGASAAASAAEAYLSKLA